MSNSVHQFSVAMADEFGDHAFAAAYEQAQRSDQGEIVEVWETITRNIAEITRDRIYHCLDR